MTDAPAPPPNPAPAPPAVPQPYGAPPAGRAAAPTPRSARALAPDVARGLVLLGIALANVPFWLYGVEQGILMKPLGDSADQVTNAVVALLADSRSYPLFALLYGYGITQILLREQAAGAPWDAARGLLVRRNLWVLAFGAVHGVLLFFGDVLGTYGLLGLLLILLVRASGRALAIVGWISFALLVLLSAVEGAAGMTTETAPGTSPFALLSPGADTYLAATGARALEWVAGILGTALGGFVLMLPTMVLGVWAARYRVLENPEPHRRRLAMIAGLGIPISLLGALPVALVLLGVLGGRPVVDLLWTMLHGGTGPIGAVAYLALIALVVGRVRAPGDRPGPIARGFAALGKRSLTGYLLQSVIFLAVFPAYTLGLGGIVGAAEATQVAVLAWLASLVLAIALEALDKPGPAEALLRRLVYGRRRTAS
ncbi:DUF418 domain-containing protein [Microcella daejeonensis]|uniref:DUF418 domain-containing protein n=1 Tax=Microcella daejeonensis TaxID=2994971 RepID=A0A9E8S7I3_9MICO|nr:DUF418 domain-containing protein [Microcella daejeonensis]WAB80510.1 DUF418 domain-containing protein [Microcella daejeonensis]